MTQQQLVMEILSDGPLHIKQVAAATGIKEPSIRRVLGQGTIRGTFTRVREGVYTLTNENSKAVFINGDSFEEIKRLDQKFDLVFLDIPYNTPAVKGGNRPLKYETIEPEQFDSILKDLKNIIHEDTYIVHCYSNAPSGWNKMLKYNNILLQNNFKCVSKNNWYKLYANGKAYINVSGAVGKPESLDIYSLSGKQIDYSKDFTLPKTSVHSQKNIEMLTDIFGYLCKPGQWLLDLFAGTGTSGIAAQNVGLNFVLIEKDPEKFQEFILSF